MLTPNEKRQRATAFVKKWQNETREEAEAKSFWDDFFQIFGIERYQVARFEYAVERTGKSKGFIDVFWAGRLLCEHKSANKDLDKAETQALDYLREIAKRNPEDVPPYVIVCDFAHFRLIDLKNETRLEFPIADLPKMIAKQHAFDFMDGIQAAFKQAEEQANIDAANAIGALYKALSEDGNDPHALKVLMIRLLFCFFADDSHIFQPDQFETYLNQYSREDGSDLGEVLNSIFTVLNTPKAKRPARMIDDLKAFEYINGNLFGETLPVFYFDQALRNQLLECSRFDWQYISPEIFGSLFQSVMDSQERREAGAHYTEKANILKVIEPLFLDELRAEFENVKGNQKKLQAFYQKIAKLTFLDPACGCGNFLIVAYDELRKLEDDVIDALYFGKKQTSLEMGLTIQTHLSQFHGIELDEFPAQIAKVAMWLVNHQCNLRTNERFGESVITVSVPLTDEAHIVNDNALNVEWAKTDYILGNPPFIGHSYRSEQQKADMARVFAEFELGKKGSKFGKLDYVACWYAQAIKLLQQNAHLRCAFVSTNSITQGEQAGILGELLFAHNIEIQFAHRTFQWESQAKGKAAVHCVIIGFGVQGTVAEKWLFDYPDIKGEPQKWVASNINQYLADGASVILPSRCNPPKGMAKMTQGSKFVDGGNWILSPDEKVELEAKYPKLKPYIKRLIGSNELINSVERYCLWFANAKLSDLVAFDKYPEIKAKKEAVKTQRLNSPTPSFQKSAETPFVVTENRQPKTNFLVIPRVSSEKREYVPLGFFTPDVVVNDAVCHIENATEYEFGILTSAMNMAWVKTVSGRLKSDYRYDANVYHSFPFPENVSEKQRAEIVRLAQGVLNAREAERQADPAVTLAMLYNPDTMPNKLRQAHKKLDQAVDKLYRKEKFTSEPERVGFLFSEFEKRQGRKR